MICEFYSDPSQEEVKCPLCGETFCHEEIYEDWYGECDGCGADLEITIEYHKTLEIKAQRKEGA